jgi:hypothetical protein
VCRRQTDPVAVRHVQGYIHGFLVLKDTDDKILSSGDLIQLPDKNRVTAEGRRANDIQPVNDQNGVYL